MERIVQMLRNQGHRVTYVNKASCNSNVFRAIRDSQYIIFAESVGKTSRTAVKNVNELVSQLDGNILGFLFV